MRTLYDALQTASAIRALKTLKLDASQQDQISLVDEIDRLRASNAELTEEIYQLRASRVELLVALEKIVIVVKGDYSAPEVMKRIARAAIAKATS